MSHCSFVCHISKCDFSSYFGLFATLFELLMKQKKETKTKLKNAFCPVMVNRLLSTYRQAVCLLNKDKQQA